MGTAEVEIAPWSATPSVAEAAVVGFPHEIKGEGIYAYVILNAGERAQRRSAARSSSVTSARRSVRSRAPTTSTSFRSCPRPARARSCAASCARSPLESVTWTRSETSRRWPTPRSFRRSWTLHLTRRIVDAHSSEGPRDPFGRGAFSRLLGATRGRRARGIRVVILRVGAP